MRIVWFVAVALALAVLPAAAQEDPCWSCHASTTPGIVEQWKSSKHFDAEIGCLDCHAAEEGEVDAFRHHGKLIAIIVSPLDCSSCHEKEYEEQKGSHHAKAGQILGSLDNFLGEVVGGPPAVNAVCRQCHGQAFVEGAYAQFDGVVELYNEKFAKPAKAIMGELKARGIISIPNFDDPIEWTWWELWHHEGRRGRHGAAMQGPDYT